MLVLFSRFKWQSWLSKKVGIFLKESNYDVYYTDVHYLHIPETFEDMTCYDLLRCRSFFMEPVKLCLSNVPRTIKLCPYFGEINTIVHRNRGYLLTPLVVVYIEFLIHKIRSV